jgi:hypothetical protein
MQVILNNKKEKEELVVKLHQENKTIRQIAEIVHMSFKDIGTIIRRTDGINRDNTDLSNKSKATRALYLFKTGKKPIDVAIELDLPSTEVEELQQEYWALNQLYELAFVYNEIRNYLQLFLKLFHSLKEHKLLSEKHIGNLLKYATLDLPYLTNEIQRLRNDVLDLEYKKKDLKDTLTLWNAQLSDLGKTIMHYQSAIDSKKQQLVRMDK